MNTNTLIAGGLFLLLAGSAEAQNEPRGRLGEPGITAQDQSWDAAQTELIANIRHDIVSDDSLSTKAHNITIVSAEGKKVVLQGAVESDAERKKVLDIARRHSKDISDKLTVEK